MVDTKNNVMFTPKDVPSIMINHSPTPKLKNVRTNSDRQFFHKNSGSQI